MDLFDLFLTKAITGGGSPSPGVVLIDKEITENGTYTAADDNADGYSEVTVDVPDESKAVLNSLIDRSITAVASDVTSIKGYAFCECKSLAEINFPEVTSIGTYAFGYCKALAEVNFPKVTFMDTYAFSNCTGLQYFDMSEVYGIPSISSNTFKSTTCIFLFRDQMQLDEYSNAENWSALANRFQIKGMTT